MKNRISQSLKAVVIITLLIISALIISAGTHSSPRQKSLGLFEGQTDVGKVNQSGSGIYDDEKAEYTVAGSGTNMWGDHDEFHFVWKRMRGNFILTARVAFIGKGVEAHRKIGWIIRPGLETDSAQVSAVVHGDGLTSLQFRRVKGTVTDEIKSNVTAPDVVQLERKGKTYVMGVARFGEPFVTEQVSDVALGDEVYVGLFVCSHNNNVVEKAAFRDVRITLPVKDEFVPYRDYIGSNLEVLDVQSGHRKVVYSVPDSLQAPNWTRDGKALIYNHNGRLYRFDLARNSPVAIDTGFAVNNNNDHVLSFDGKMIGISNHSKKDDNKSIIYVLPVEGGNPGRITPRGPSYLHGWSPDGKFLIYTGQRNGEFDIYKTSIRGGDETRLTTAQGLDDGPEYSPDGKYIYFNSTRTGTMQIWRMKPDGSNQQQITNDDYNNWFPHISPNGQWICFLSFSRDVAPGDHPFYKRVYLRLMPIGGGQPKVVAYVYGGQGTINVPSWSPDSKRVAFVSNTDGIVN
ncbi:MAG TPA: biopolymer transporter TolR [Blastocatellia bacterium]|nr:biopolymer transporter TolR [Blastocatellia bacterium]HAF23013.1 biopolymer transporter TolR [Blastocatellia bacterium]